MPTRIKLPSKELTAHILRELDIDFAVMTCLPKNQTGKMHALAQIVLCEDDPAVIIAARELSQAILEMYGEKFGPTADITDLETQPGGSITVDPDKTFHDDR